MSRLSGIIASAKRASETANKAGNALWGSAPPGTVPPSAKAANSEGIFAALDELESTINSIHKELERF